ncbi:hypothetical protein LTLLF_104110 [Microtus ochrogaster]|uniref:Uncharacterized protein n=1 Tax=Microtus ochrogaster TaxID=79684 RepID=A0A8J6GEZ9_MICOH|nr:hypothetical protein LTLLF_103960 [Microtus ochrogaster]KAH0509548.1 hypothetical protein LTLLF_104110 [Microtus ochrogaster]
MKVLIKKPAVCEELVVSEKLKGFSSKKVSESVCENELRTVRNARGQSTRVQKKGHHGCSRKSKRKKIWKVVTKVKSVFPDNSKNKKEEKKHIIMVFSCQLKKKLKHQGNENAEASGELHTPK